MLLDGNRDNPEVFFVKKDFGIFYFKRENTNGIHVVYMRKNGNSVQVDLSGDLNKYNITHITESIFTNINPSTKLVEFHFEDVEAIDFAAMAMMVVTAKNLRRQNITCRAMGLTEDSLNLATILGLSMMA